MRPSAAGSALLVSVASAVLAACAATVPRVERPRDPPRAERPPARARGRGLTQRGEEPPSTPAAAPVRAVTIGAGGDVLVHLKVARSALEHEDEGGFEHVFGELREVVGDDEIAFVNLETPLSERVPAETGDPPVLGAPASVASALAAAGIDVASVANNHSYDQTALGMEDTLRALSAARVRAVGAGPSEEEAPGPVVVEQGGVRVAFLAFTERINRGPVARDTSARVPRFERELAARALARAREQADVVVVSMHWSHDFVESPRLAQRALARWLVERGADVILGHGPHVLQEVERLESARGDAVCAYSLGNLVSNQGLRYAPGRRIPAGLHPAVVRPETRDGAWLRVRLVLDGERMRIERLEAVPLWTHNNYVRVARREEPRLDIRVRPLRAVDPAVRDERRPVIERALGAAVRLLE